MLRKSRICGLIAVILSLTLAACSSQGTSQTDYDRLQERIVSLERQLAETQEALDELRTAAFSDQVGTGESVSGAGDNGSAGQGDGVLITFEQYQQLEIGMTYAEVVEIAGGEGQAMSESADTVIYSYMGVGDLGANAVLTFHKGKLLNKAQTGLK